MEPSPPVAAAVAVFGEVNVERQLRTTRSCSLKKKKTRAPSPQQKQEEEEYCCENGK
jgi:hypothetical protein